MKHKEALITGAFVILAAIVTGVLGMWQGAFSNNSGDSGQTSNVAQVSTATPSMPRITAERNIDVRRGPGTGFDRIAVLNTGDHLDILGISEDDRWYQVLLPNGDEETGWVIAASSAGTVSGNIGALAVIIPTETPTFTATFTPTATNTLTATPTATDTPEPTATPTETNTPTATNTPEPTATPTETTTPTDTPTVTLTHTATATPPPTDTSAPPSSTPQPTATPIREYPCEATVESGGGVATQIQQVYSQPRTSSSRLNVLLRVGDTVLVREDRNDRWYRITESDGTLLGWIQSQYLDLSSTCP